MIYFLFRLVVRYRRELGQLDCLCIVCYSIFILSRAKLYVLSRCEPVLTFVKKADYQFYQNLVEVLIPDVLRPIPGTLTQAIRNFAKGLENWLLTAMNGCPEDIIFVKV